MSIKDNMLEADEPQALDDEESPELGNNGQYLKAKVPKSIKSAPTLLR